MLQRRMAMNKFWTNFIVSGLTTSETLCKSNKRGLTDLLAERYRAACRVESQRFPLLPSNTHYRSVLVPPVLDEVTVDTFAVLGSRCHRHTIAYHLWERLSKCRRETAGRKNLSRYIANWYTKLHNQISNEFRSKHLTLSRVLFFVKQPSKKKQKENKVGFRAF